MQKLFRIALALAIASTCALAQEHRWAGRTLTPIEWEIHESLASLPFHGVFDDVRFELQGTTVTLSGDVVREKEKQSAERSVRRIAGVSNVVNRIEVLPSSRIDDALRTNVYRAIYLNQPLTKYGTRGVAPIQIVVKNGWVRLEGVVDSDEDRGLAYLRALQVTAHVSDNLRVAEQGS
jgi:osmotically-inducible protein OsmY